MNESTFDVLCVGIAVADHVCRPIERLPRAGELVLTDRTEIAIGGCAANVSVDLARLGLRSAMVGRVGQDLFGDFIRESLRQSGVDTQWLWSCDAPTSCTLVVNVAGEDRRFIHCVGANNLVDGSEVPPATVRQAKAVYVGGFGLVDGLNAGAVRDVFTAARECGNLTVLDVVLPEAVERRDWVRDVLPLTDVFLPNTDEAALLTGFRDPLDQVRVFCDWGAVTAVVTSGEHGAVLMDAEGVLSTPGFRMESVDGTGSGDAFDAGYIFARLSGCSRVKALTYACAVGASCVRAVGATTSVFRRGELEAFLEGHALQVDEVLV